MLPLDSSSSGSLEIIFDSSVSSGSACRDGAKFIIHARRNILVIVGACYLHDITVSLPKVRDGKVQYM